MLRPVKNQRAAGGGCCGYSTLPWAELPPSDNGKRSSLCGCFVLLQEDFLPLVHFEGISSPFPSTLGHLDGVSFGSFPPPLAGEEEAGWKGRNKQLSFRFPSMQLLSRLSSALRKAVLSLSLSQFSPVQG